MLSLLKWVVIAVAAVVVCLAWRARKANPHLSWPDAFRQTLGLASFAAPIKGPNEVIAAQGGGA